MTLSKRQYGYPNQRVILFRLQYETHSLQMNTEYLCRFIVAPTPKLLERRYDLRLVVVPCQYFPISSPFLQPISPSPSSHISSVAVPHLLLHRIHLYCPSSLPSCLSATVFTAELVYHPHYTASKPRLHCPPPASLLRFSSHYLPSHCVLLCHCLYTFSDRIFPRSTSCCTTLLAPLCSALLFSLSALIFSLQFSLLARLFSLSVIFSLRSDLTRFLSPCLHSALLQSDHLPQICLLRYACSISGLLNSDFSAHALICLFQYAWIRSLRSALSFVTLELLISFKINHHYIKHHLLLACTIK